RAQSRARIRGNRQRAGKRLQLRRPAQGRQQGRSPGGGIFLKSSTVTGQDALGVRQARAGRLRVVSTSKYKKRASYSTCVPLPRMDPPQSCFASSAWFVSFTLAACACALY